MTADTVPGAGTADTIPDRPAGPPWTYVLAHESWWAAANQLTESTPLIYVHHEAYRENGAKDGVEWEFGIEWVDGRVRLEWDGAEEAVQTERPDLLDRLGGLPSTATTADVVRALSELGFVDATDRVMPAHWRS